MNCKMRELKKMIIYSGVAILLIALFAMGGIFMTAASADNCYVGSWVLELIPDGTVRVEILENGSMYIILPDDPGTGYIYEYIIGYNGELIALNGSEMVFGATIFDAGTMVDYDGNVWVRNY